MKLKKIKASPNTNFPIFERGFQITEMEGLSSTWTYSDGFKLKFLNITNKVAKIIQYVNTGEVRSGGPETLLNSGAIGSCVVITAFDSGKKIGAMAHVMLPGNSPLKNQLHTTRYAANAIEEMLSQLKGFEVKLENIEICLVGGANVLKRENDHIGKDNLKSVEKLLQEKQIEIKAKNIGGFERRTVLFDIDKGCIYYTVGDSKQKILWQTGNKQ